MSIAQTVSIGQKPIDWTKNRIDWRELYRFSYTTHIAAGRGSYPPHQPSLQSTGVIGSSNNSKLCCKFRMRMSHPCDKAFCS